MKGTLTIAGRITSKHPTMSQMICHEMNQNIKENQYGIGKKNKRDLINTSRYEVFDTDTRGFSQ